MTWRWPQTVSSRRSRSIASPARESSCRRTACGFRFHADHPVAATHADRARAHLDVVESVDLPGVARWSPASSGPTRKPAHPGYRRSGRSAPRLPARDIADATEQTVRASQIGTGPEQIVPDPSHSFGRAPRRPAHATDPDSRVREVRHATLRPHHHRRTPADALRRRSGATGRRSGARRWRSSMRCSMSSIPMPCASMPTASATCASGWPRCRPRPRRTCSIAACAASTSCARCSTTTAGTRPTPCAPRLAKLDRVPRPGRGPDPRPGTAARQARRRAAARTGLAGLRVRGRGLPRLLRLSRRERPGGTGDEQRAAWIRDRLAEIAAVAAPHARQREPLQPSRPCGGAVPGRQQSGNDGRSRSGRAARPTSPIVNSSCRREGRALPFHASPSLPPRPRTVPACPHSPTSTCTASIRWSIRPSASRNWSGVAWRKGSRRSRSPTRTTCSRW